ncbi:uncharacterized protein LOC128958405 [Oppia nitens]|uniref:uncharacterized protein LOC128958405 n=1 Tax=Oppia nitens TaxID=1686743 RepID=UPI0023DC7CE2|nr:uncharacterized protein LOC128958405 [Oppia nitens]
MFKYLAILLLAIGCKAEEAQPVDSAQVASGSVLTSLTGLGGAYADFQKQILASQPPEKTFTLRAGEALPAHYGTPQVVSSGPDHQELVVQHPQPRKILVRVVKPIIFEERIVIVPYRRVTHEVRPVIEERHTVIYGKDGKQIGGQGDSKSSSYPVASASGASSRVVAQPVYTEPIVRKVGQTLTKRTSIDFSAGSRPNPLENRRSQRDRIMSRIHAQRERR